MLTLYIIRARPCKHSDVISLKYTDICGGLFRLDFWISKWISGFQIGFLVFRVDFWISDWISADSVRDFFRGGPLDPLSPVVVKSWRFRGSRASYAAYTYQQLKRRHSGPRMDAQAMVGGSFPSC